MLKVECNQIWDDYVKTDNNAKGMRYRPWPFFVDWQEVFGKERATGENAEDCNDAEQTPLVPPVHTPPEPMQPRMEEDRYDGDSETMSVCQPSNSTGSKRKRSGKGKKVSDGSDTEMVEIFGKFCEQTNNRLGEIAKYVGYECKMSEKRTGLFEALGELGVLSNAEQIFMHKTLSNNNKDCESFFNLPITARAQMVRMMLDGQM